MHSNLFKRIDTTTVMGTVSHHSRTFGYVPGSLEHYTTPDDRQHQRISLAGDIILTLKHRTDTESGLLSPKYWKRF